MIPIALKFDLLLQIKCGKQDLNDGITTNYVRNVLSETILSLIKYSLSC